MEQNESLAVVETKQEYLEKVINMMIEKQKTIADDMLSKKGFAALVGYIIGNK